MTDDDALLVTLERVEAEELLQFGLEDGGVDGHSSVFSGINITKKHHKSKRMDTGWRKKNFCCYLNKKPYICKMAAFDC